MMVNFIKQLVSLKKSENIFIVKLSVRNLKMRYYKKNDIHLIYEKVCGFFKVNVLNETDIFYGLNVIPIQFLSFNATFKKSVDKLENQFLLHFSVLVIK